MNIKFFLDSANPSDIVKNVYISVEGVPHAEWYSGNTGISVISELWDEELQRIKCEKGQCPENRQLDLLESKSMDILEENKDDPDAFIAAMVEDAIFFLESCYLYENFEMFWEELEDPASREYFSNGFVSSNKSFYGVNYWLECAYFLSNTLDKAGYSFSEQPDNLKALKLFCDWGLEKGYYSFSNEGVLGRFKVNDTRSGALEPFELKRLLEIPSDNESMEACKNLLLMQFFTGESFSKIVGIIPSIGGFPKTIDRGLEGVEKQKVQQLMQRLDGDPSISVDRLGLSYDTFALYANDLCEKAHIQRDIDALRNRQYGDKAYMYLELLEPTYQMLHETFCLIEVCEFYFEDEVDDYFFLPEDLRKRVIDLKSILAC